jgi:hypothetical protein
MDKAYTRRYRLKKIILAQGLAFFIVVAIASALIFYAQGYTINFKNFKIIKSGLLVLNFTDKPESISIPGKEVSLKNTIAQTLQGGDYKIEAKKSSCETWNRNIKIEQEKLTQFDNIIFIKNDPSVSEMTQDEINWMNSTPDSSLAPSKNGALSSNGYEIWVGNRLITRLSSKISQVKWYDDGAHITYISENKIRIIDIDGYNNTNLVSLENATNAKYLFRYQGKVIYFKDNNNYYKAKVRCD